MLVIGRLLRLVRRHVRNISWGVVFAALIVHFAVMWAGLALLGEDKLTPLVAYPYYYMTTATTIGYGDLSPSTPAGRALVAFVLMPGAVALFATVLAKTSASLLSFWKRHHMGKMSYDDFQGHTIIVGWRGAETERLVRLLLADSATDDEGIVLVAPNVAENPLPDEVRFVAAPCLTHSQPYVRAGIEGAARIIVHPGTDEQALAAVFALMTHQPAAHVVAHFESPSTASIVAAHHPRVECTRPLTAEVIARAAQDPGSSTVTIELLSLDSGPTQFSIAAPDVRLVYGRVALALRMAGGLLIGCRLPDGQTRLNLKADAVLPPRATLFYLADRRIGDDGLDWAAAQVEP